MAKARKTQPFDVQVFLNTVADGRTVSSYRKNRKVFSRETLGMPSFTFRRARSRSASSPSRERRRSSRSTEMGNSSVRAA